MWQIADVWSDHGLVGLAKVMNKRHPRDWDEDKAKQSLLGKVVDLNLTASEKVMSSVADLADQSLLFENDPMEVQNKVTKHLETNTISVSIV